MYHLSVYLHIVAAAVWVGGLLFLALVAVPAARQLPPPDRARVTALLGRRFLPLAWGALGVLIVTGVINAAYRGVTWEGIVTGRLIAGPFGRVLVAKLILVAVTLGLSALHDFRIGPAARRLAQRGRADAPGVLRLRRAATRIGRLNAVLALIIVALAVLLVRGVP